MLINLNLEGLNNARAFGGLHFSIFSFGVVFGSEDAKQLAVVSPAIMGPAYFREAAEVIGAAAGGPPDRAKMMEIFQRHGMTVAPPPHAKK